MKTFPTKAARQSRGAVGTKVLPALEAPAGLQDHLALRLVPESSHAVLHITPTPPVVLVYPSHLGFVCSTPATICFRKSFNRVKVLISTTI